MQCLACGSDMKLRKLPNDGKIWKCCKCNYAELFRKVDGKWTYTKRFRKGSD